MQMCDNTLYELAANRGIHLACSKEAAAKHACCTPQYTVIGKLSISGDAFNEDEIKEQLYNSSTMPETQMLAEICLLQVVTARTHIMLKLDMFKQVPSVDAFALQQSPVKDVTERTMT